RSCTSKRYTRPGIPARRYSASETPPEERHISFLRSRQCQRSEKCPIGMLDSLRRTRWVPCRFAPQGEYPPDRSCLSRTAFGDMELEPLDASHADQRSQFGMFL